jgi:hypothetical protein
MAEPQEHPDGPERPSGPDDGSAHPTDQDGPAHPNGPNRSAGRPPLLAGALLGVSGLAEVLAGLTMAGPSPYVTIINDSAYWLDPHVWGWCHLGAGLLSALAGALLITAWRGTLVLALAVTVLSIGADAMTFPYEPYRAMLGAGMSVGVLWLLIRHVRDRSSRLPA